MHARHPIKEMSEIQIIYLATHSYFTVAHIAIASTMAVPLTAKFSCKEK